jgi:sterol 14alpha-demethylase
MRDFHTMTFFKEVFVFSPSVVILAAAPIFTLWYFWWSSKQSTNNSKDDGIPTVPGAVPILGHALAYKKNPPQFLSSAFENYGNVIRINLAGKQMVVFGRDCPELRQVASAPERTVSARDAVQEVGFAETLGYFNISKGTDIHKHLLKSSLLTPTKLQAHLEHVYSGLKDAIRIELEQSDNPQSIDFMKWMRRVMLRVTLTQLIGSSFWKHVDGRTFLSNYVKFQDLLEDATAQAAVLPIWMALPLCLWGVQRRRLVLQKELKRVIKSMEGEVVGIGVWLEAIRSEKYSLDEVAELIVGLLFAAHKNPAIGAVQSYLLLQEQGTDKDKEVCIQEAQKVSKNPSEILSAQPLAKSCPRISRVCSEALRVTAHTIGALRTLREPLVLKESGIQLEKGTTVAVSHIAPNLDKQQWASTSFSTAANDDKLYEDPYRFTTFSHGTHICPGQGLALALIQCTLVQLLAEYEVNLPAKIPPLCFERATLAQRETPVKVSITKRET